MRPSCRLAPSCTERALCRSPAQKAQHADHTALPGRRPRRVTGHKCPPHLLRVPLADQVADLQDGLPVGFQQKLAGRFV